MMRQQEHKHFIAKMYCKIEKGGRKEWNVCVADMIRTPSMMFDYRKEIPLDDVPKYKEHDDAAATNETISEKKPISYSFDYRKDIPLPDVTK
jgi:hypothetical protein